MKKLCSMISIGLIFILIFGESMAIASDGMPQKKRRPRRQNRPGRPGRAGRPGPTAREARIANQNAEHQALLERLAVAEKRAQEAESAAAKAVSDARSAQEQAAQATGDARRANDALAALRDSLARLEQNSERNARDTATLNRLDEQIAAGIKTARATEDTNAKKIATLEQRTEGVVTSSTKVPIKIYGNILLSSSYVDHGANTDDIPLFGQKRGTSTDQDHRNYNMTVRQSRFGLRYETSLSEHTKLTGHFEFDLLGGKPAFANGVNFDIFRVRLAYGRLDWKKNSFEAGQDWTVFSPLNPTTLASYAITGFSTSGNLWIRAPQIRYEHREGNKSKFIFAAALVDPDAGDNAGNPAARVIGLGERGSLPAFESRLGFTTPTHGKESSAGISGRYSRLLGVPGSPAGTLVRSPIDSYGVSGDWNLWLSSGFRITGEAFHGRALGIFSGNIAQNSVVVGGRARGINSTGGWMELHGEAPAGYQGGWKKFSANLGYGIEDNRNRDLLAGLRERNQTYMINGQYKFSPHFTTALEYRRIITDFYQQPATDQKLNWVSLAFLYSF